MTGIQGTFLICIYRGNGASLLMLALDLDVTRCRLLPDAAAANYIQVIQPANRYNTED